MQRPFWRMCIAVTCLAATAGLASCGSSGDGSAPCAGNNSFAATVKSGGVTVATLGGTACWSLTGNLDWALGLTDENGVDRIVIGREFGGAPIPGEDYPLPIGGGDTEFGTRALFLLYNAPYACSPADGTGRIYFDQFTLPTVSGFIPSLWMLCSTGGGQTAVVQLEVTSFVATEGKVTLIP